MKSLLLLCVFVAFASAAAPTDLSNYDFARYVKDFHKGYSVGSNEWNKRKAVFDRNLAEIRLHNSQGHSWTKGVNEFTDMTPEEFKQRNGVRKGLTRTHPQKLAMESRMGPAPKLLPNLPTSVDWRTNGVISTVKDQGHCGSCWAFATTEMVESYVAIHEKSLLVLSPQQLVGCVQNPQHCGGGGGCDGATAELGFDYLVKNGMASEWTYPYTSYQGQSSTCQFNNTAQGTPAVVGIDGYGVLPSNSYDAVMNHLATVGPLAVSVQANVWQHYQGGVFSGCTNMSNIDIDHAVQLVGYGTDPETKQDYWLVRNSWAATWGEQGYIRIARGTQADACGTDSSPADGDGCSGGPASVTVCGHCGILYDTAYPTGAHVL